MTLDERDDVKIEVVLEILQCIASHREQEHFDSSVTLEKYFVGHGLVIVPYDYTGQ